MTAPEEGGPWTLDDLAAELEKTKRPKLKLRKLNADKPSTTEQAEALTERPHPNDYWIVSKYNYKPWPTLEQAQAERDKLAFPGAKFHVIHCKRRMKPSDSREIIAELSQALTALLAAIDEQDTRGIMPADKGIALGRARAAIAKASS